MNFKEYLDGQLNENKFKSGDKVSWITTDGDKMTGSIDKIQDDQYKIINVTFNGKDVKGFDLKPVSWMNSKAKKI